MERETRARRGQTTPVPPPRPSSVNETRSIWVAVWLRNLDRRGARWACRPCRVAPPRRESAAHRARGAGPPAAFSRAIRRRGRRCARTPPFLGPLDNNTHPFPFLRQRHNNHPTTPTTKTAPPAPPSAA